MWYSTTQTSINTELHAQARKVYGFLVRKLHPDILGQDTTLSDDEREGYSKLFEQVQEAYENHDIPTLETLGAVFGWRNYNHTIEDNNTHNPTIENFYKEHSTILTNAEELKLLWKYYISLQDTIKTHMHSDSYKLNFLSTEEKNKWTEEERKIFSQEIIALEKRLQILQNQ